MAFSKVWTVVVGQKAETARDQCGCFAKLEV